MTPLILKSTLTNRPHWYIATRYRTKSRVDPATGKTFHWVIATTKYDVTDQMRAILKAERKR